MTKTADKTGKQGEFIKELASRPRHKISARRVLWREPLAGEQGDKTVPRTRLADAQHAERPNPKPTEDIPRTPDGNIDIAEVKSDLASQLKAARTARKG